MSGVPLSGMRVVMVSHLLVRMGGPFVRACAESASAAGCDVTLVSASPVWSRSAVPDAIDLPYAYIPRGYFPAISTHLAAASADVSFRRKIRLRDALSRADCVHAHGLVPEAPPEDCRGAPVVATIHAEDPERFYGSALGKLRDVAQRRVVRLIVPIPQLADRVAAAFSFPMTRIHSVPNPVSDVFFDVERSSAPGHIRVIFVGNFVSEKRAELAFDSIARLAETHPELHVTLTARGRGSYGDYERRAWPKNFTVDISGPIGRESVASLMADHDVLISTSRWESFGLSMAEALAVGLPVVATRTAGSNYVLDQMPGCAVMPTDAAPDEIAQALFEVVSGDSGPQVEERRLRSLHLFSTFAVGRALRDVYALAAEGVEP